MEALNQKRRPAVETALVSSCIAASSVTSGASPALAMPPTDVYQDAGECVNLHDNRSGRYLSLDDSGYSLKLLDQGPTPFRMQATALGRYLL